MSEASLAVSKMVKMDAWQDMLDESTGELHEVAVLHEYSLRLHSRESFGVTRDGDWASVLPTGDGGSRFERLSEELHLTIGLVKMLQLGPETLRSEILRWPLTDPPKNSDLDELWELLPWRQAIRTGLRWKNNYWTRMAVGWVIELKLAGDFAADLRESATDNERSSSTLQKIMVLLADSGD